MTDKLFAYARDMDLVVRKTGGRHSTLIVTEKDMGAQGFILGCHTMDPGGGAPEHAHENESEAMFFYEGNAVRIGISCIKPYINSGTQWIEAKEFNKILTQLFLQFSRCFLL